MAGIRLAARSWLPLSWMRAAIELAPPAVVLVFRGADLGEAQGVGAADRVGELAAGHDAASAMPFTASSADFSRSTSARSNTRAPVAPGSCTEASLGSGCFAQRSTVSLL